MVVGKRSMPQAITNIFPALAGLAKQNADCPEMQLLCWPIGRQPPYRPSMAMSHSQKISKACQLARP
jgi:hypothetical protein